MLQRRGLGAGTGLEAASGKKFRPKLYSAECGFSNGRARPLTSCESAVTLKVHREGRTHCDQRED